MSLEPPWKVASIGTPYILIRGPWGRQNCFKPKRHYLVLAASEASKQDVWGASGCNFSWRFQWHHRRPCPTPTAEDIADFRPWFDPVKFRAIIRYAFISRSFELTWFALLRSYLYLSDIDGRRYRRFSPILGSSPPPWRPCCWQRQ